MCKHFRPYEPLDMTTKKWQDVPVERVKFKDLRFSQESVYIEALINSDNIDPPLVVEYEGELWLVDGHTRVTKWIISGVDEGFARVLRRQHCPIV